MNFNQRIPNFKKQHQKSIPPTSTSNVGRKYSVFSSDLKVTDMKRARLSPSRLVHLSSCSAAQHISPPHLVIWSTQPVQMFKPWNTKKIQAMALWQAEGANSETQTLSFCKNTLVTSFSPAHSHHLVIKILIKTVWPNILLRLISVAAQVRCERN